MRSSGKRAKTPEERRRRYLEAQSRYNTSSKGQKRNRAYEERKRPGRIGWEPMRDALHKKGELEVRELEGVVVTEQDYQGVQLAEQLGLLGKEIRIRIKRGGET